MQQKLLFLYLLKKVFLVLSEVFLSNLNGNFYTFKWSTLEDVLNQIACINHYKFCKYIRSLGTMNLSATTCFFIFFALELFNFPFVFQMNLFILPPIDTHARNFERFWGLANWGNKKQRGTSRNKLNNYLLKFFVRQEVGHEMLLIGFYRKILIIALLCLKMKYVIGVKMVEDKFIVSIIVMQWCLIFIFNSEQKFLLLQVVLICSVKYLFPYQGRYDWSICSVK